MATTPQISGLPSGMSGSVTSSSAYNVLLRDADARAERKDILHQQVGPSTYYDYSCQISAVKIDNSLNSNASAYLKFYNSADPGWGSDAPLAILRCRPGKVAEYLLLIPSAIAAFDNLSYTVVTKGGTTGSAKQGNPVIVDMALTIR